MQTSLERPQELEQLFLLHITATIKLLGAQIFLVGIRPEAAQNIIGLDIDLDMLISYSDLSNAIEAMLHQSGWMKR